MPRFNRKKKSNPKPPPKEEDDLESTITLDSTLEDGEGVPRKSEFKPVKPGGKKLDETIELTDSEEEEKEDVVNNHDVSKESHYTTTVQSPGQISFRAPGGAETSTPRKVATPIKVKSSIQATPGPFEIEDEFCQSLEESKETTTRANLTSDETNIDYSSTKTMNTFVDDDSVTESKVEEKEQINPDEEKEEEKSETKSMANSWIMKELRVTDCIRNKIIAMAFCITALYGGYRVIKAWK